MEQLVSNSTDFHEIWNLGILLKPVEKIQFSVKYDKNTGSFTWRRMDIYNNISLNSSYN